MQVEGACLGRSGWEAARVGDVGLLTAAGGIIVEEVAASDLVVVSAGTGFGEVPGFADTVFGRAPGCWRAAVGRRGFPVVARGRVG